MVSTDVDDDFLTDLRQERVMAIIRGQDTEAVIEVALALFEAGLRFVEVALTSPASCRAIAAIRSRTPVGSRIGAGTVLTHSDVDAVERAGAQFVVTPGVLDSIAEAVRRGLPVAAGAMTPTEAYSAHALGASVVKLFPASAGGPRYLKAMRDPFPQIPLMAVGGVGLAEMEEYLRVGAIGVGVGSPLVGDAVNGGDTDALRERARAYLAVAHRFSS